MTYLTTENLSLSEPVLQYKIEMPNMPSGMENVTSRLV